MIRYKLVLLTFPIFFSLIAYSQENSETVVDKKFDHYIGVQVNELVKQIFSFNQNESPVSPYLLNYSINLTESGYGGNVGVGYFFDQVKENQAQSSLEVETENISFRIGAERKYQWGKKWLASANVDFIYINEKEESLSTTTDVFGEITTTTSESKKNILGSGVRGTIHYMITPKVLIGTEASYYFTSTTETTKDRVEVPGFPATETEDNPTTRRIVFQPPIILWLTIRF